MPSDEDVDYVSVEEASSSLVASKEVDLEKEGGEGSRKKRISFGKTQRVFGHTFT